MVEKIKEYLVSLEVPERDRTYYAQMEPDHIFEAGRESMRIQILLFIKSIL